MDRRESALYEIQDEVGRRIGKRLARPATDDPAKIDQDEIAAATSDLQSERKGAFRIERKGNRWLTDPPAHGRLATQQAVGLKPIHDGGGRLDGKAGHSRDFDLGKPSEPSRQRKNQPFVVETHARLICAARHRNRRRRGIGLDRSRHALLDRPSLAARMGLALAAPPERGHFIGRHNGGAEAISQ